ncbi:hypothetical protein DICVIV_00092 [Dictyocaulus viviparus]|uniref:Uncharacterized protein n=1 Tax=Dictyocaulus viviparus TaxID=29172 RepID=A0A0D8YC78_DICVI|nr:hypothetical protein DICVIV_00092 [Dictyocaulus viviparus]
MFGKGQINNLDDTRIADQFVDSEIYARVYHSCPVDVLHLALNRFPLSSTVEGILLKRSTRKRGQTDSEVPDAQLCQLPPSLCRPISNK